MESSLAEDSLRSDMDTFGISPFGFVFEEPLMDLPEYYHIWMDIAHNLPQLIKSQQLRSMVQKMPTLSLSLLKSSEELWLAHMALSFITMGYVWQEEHNPAQRLPEALAVPFTLVSRQLCLPAIVTYTDCVLANWRLKDPTGDLELGNMELIFNFPGDESCRGFLLVSLIVEKSAVSGLKGILAVRRAMETRDETSILNGLDELVESIKQMKEDFKLMHEHVNQTDFYGTLRIFFSGWKDNPLLPNGLVYEGVSDEPVFLSGCSAAQSSAMQCFDAFLGVQHEDASADFLRRLRPYMPLKHRQMIESLSVGPQLRDLVLSDPAPHLQRAYNRCVAALEDIRNFHLCMVAKYIAVPSGLAQATANTAAITAAGRCPLSGGLGLKATGTGGSNPMVFLKSVRDTTHRATLLCATSSSSAA